MKKKLAILLIAVMVLSLSMLGVTSKDKAYARTAQMHLEIPDSIKKENEFKVKVILDSDVQLYSIDAYLSYNTDVLEFIPDSNYVTGADGVLELKDIYEEETRNATYEITFKAIDTGLAEIALTDVYLIDYADLDYITVSPSSKQFEVTVNKSVAEDARLSELIVAPGELTQSFDPNRLAYEMHVGYEVETIGVSAIPMNEDSVVGLEMPEQLQVGENIIKVTVTALSGNVNEYTIVVIRDEVVSTTEEEMEGTTEEITTEAGTTNETTGEETTMDDDTIEETTSEDSTTEEATTEAMTTESPEEEPSSETTTEKASSETTETTMQKETTTEVDSSTTVTTEGQMTENGNGDEAAGTESQQESVKKEKATEVMQ